MKHINNIKVTFSIYPLDCGPKSMQLSLPRAEI